MVFIWIRKLLMAARVIFILGVSDYPEKHFEAPSMEFDLQKAKEKLDVGAQYIMTQIFFDNKKYFKYVVAC